MQMSVDRIDMLSLNAAVWNGMNCVWYILHVCGVVINVCILYAN